MTFRGLQQVRRASKTLVCIGLQPFTQNPYNLHKRIRLEQREFLAKGVDGCLLPNPLLGGWHRHSSSSSFFSWPAIIIIVMTLLLCLHPPSPSLLWQRRRQLQWPKQQATLPASPHPLTPLSLSSVQICSILG